jgi:hypothetical protein
MSFAKIVDKIVSCEVLWTDQWGVWYTTIISMPVSGAETVILNIGGLAKSVCDFVHA